MKRTLIQLDDETYRRLRQQAFRTERSVSSIVREMVAKGLDGDAPQKRRTHLADFASVRAGRSTQGALSPVSEKHDAAVAAAFEK